MDIKQGHPEGYDVRGRREYKSEGARLQEKQQKSIEELYRSVPAHMVQNSEPIQYGSDGLPLVDDPERFPELDQEPVQPKIKKGERKAQNDAEKFFAPRQPQQAPPQRKENMSQQKIQHKQPTEALSKGSTQYHPVLSRMLNAFGLKKNALHKLELYSDSIGVVTYTMTLVTEELQSWALMESKNRHFAEMELAVVYYELLSGCCSVVAIDDIPVWQIFNLSVSDNEELSLQEDPLNMSSRLRKICARQLADLLWTETVPLGDKLLQFYQEKVIAKKVQSSLDKELLDKVRYVCPIDDCDNYEFFTPTMEGGVEKNYFCKYHGIQLIKTIDVLKELDVPLA